MKHLSLNNPVTVGKKYILMGHIILEAKIVTESGVLFSVVSREKPSAVGAKVGSEIFYHNNDKDFWAGVKEYIPSPVKKTVFIIIWDHPKGHVSVTKDSELHAAEYYIREGYIAVKGFGVEFYVPQTGG